MQRAQASVEYLLLTTAIVLAVCGLVRFATPVEELGRALVRAVAHRPSREAPSQHPHRARPHPPPGRRARRPHPSYCPIVPGSAGSGQGAAFGPLATSDGSPPSGAVARQAP
ncbi:MAG: hypothetical protein ACXVRW_20245 [Solirubrobacteraceae bacterium]